MLQICPPYQLLPRRLEALVKEFEEVILFVHTFCSQYVAGKEPQQSR